MFAFLFSLSLCLAFSSTASGKTEGSSPEGVSGDKRLMAKLQKLEKTLLHKMNAVETACQRPFPAEESSFSSELSALKERLLAMENDLQTTKLKLQAAETALQSVQANSQSIAKGGSTFVRWGRTTCTSTSQLVYSGVAGGSWFGHTGAAANRLCLTMTPELDEKTRAPYPGYLYGTEYQAIHGHHDQDVPCSVCRAHQTTTIMVPATRTCPSGWTAQYNGYLVTGYYLHSAASEYVCLDGQPEDVPKGRKNEDGSTWYYTLTRCGSLPCPPYVNDTVVTCVVCSK